MYKPSQVFAAIDTNPSASKSRPEIVVKEEKPKISRKDTGNEIQVSATGEMSLAPDRCRVTICVNSIKDTAQDAKNSVSRRLDYILQSLNNHQIKVQTCFYFTRTL